jgi:hypothetical protein
MFISIGDTTRVQARHRAGSTLARHPTAAAVKGRIDKPASAERCAHPTLKLGFYLAALGHKLVVRPFRVVDHGFVRVEAVASV